MVCNARLPLKLIEFIFREVKHLSVPAKMINSCCMSQNIVKHCQLVPLKQLVPSKNVCFAVFKTVFHLIFNAKIMSMFEITFGISFICNDLDLTDILSKTENALSTAIYQSEVRQLEKKH